MTIGDATKTLASRIWDTWIPFGTESETEVTTVASCRIPLADILAAGKCGFHLRLCKASQAAKGLTRMENFLLGWVCRRTHSGKTRVPVMAFSRTQAVTRASEKPGCHSSISCMSDEVKALLGRCAGKASGTWKLMRPDKLGQTRPCGHVSMRSAWLPAISQ